MELAQIIMAITLILMISGKTPLYLTAILGSALSVVAAGFPLTGNAEVTLRKLLISGLNPVIIDMLGVLLFIGIMEKTGYLDVIIKKIMEIGRKIGGGSGVATAGGIAAGLIGGLTSFTQPAVTAAITGPASVKLGLDPNKSAGIHAHAAHLGNMAGFTHPTFLAVLATTGVQFGVVNILGAIAALTIFMTSYYRAKKSMANSVNNNATEEVVFEVIESKKLYKAVLPFALLFIGFALGIPIFIVGVICSVIVIILARESFVDGEKAMMFGASRIATPLFAIITFLFMSAVINKIGLVKLVSVYLLPYLELAPLQILLLVSAITGLVTQSNAASAAIVIPFLQLVMQTGANPVGAAAAAIAGCAIMQFYLTGGPLTALPTVIPVIPGSDLKSANKFQRPSILAGLVMAFLLTFLF